MNPITGSHPGAAGEGVSWDLHLPEGAGPHPVVLVLHGFKGFRGWGFFPELSRRLAAAGLAALSLDFSHNGVGVGPDSGEFLRLDLFRRNRASYELADLESTLARLDEGAFERVDPRRVGFLGHSRGAPTALLGGARRQAAPVVTWAGVRSHAFGAEQVRRFREEGRLEVPNARTGQLMILDRSALDDVDPMPAELDVDRVLPRLGERLLVVHGEDDRTVPFAAAEGLLAASGGRAALEAIPGADHVFGCRHPFAGPTPAFESAVAASLEHLRRRLLNAR